MKVLNKSITDNYAIYNCDTIELAQNMEDESVGFSVFSPPFESLYTFSNSDRDLSNCANSEQFWKQYNYLIKESYRVMKKGRLIAIHCMNLPTSKQNHGFIGIRDFRGEIIRAYQKEGFIYHSEVCIWKDPVIAMQRTKALGLLHKTVKKDSSMSRQGIADYLIVMRKDGLNENPIDGAFDYYVGDDVPKHFKEIKRKDSSIIYTMANSNASEIDIWQRYASPVWMDIRPTNTLQFRNAKESDDERHIAVLQLDVIERAIQLWSKKGDVVWSPFMGIGSEGYVAVQNGRKFIGAELKESYFKLAERNMMESTIVQEDLFS